MYDIAEQLDKIARQLGEIAQFIRATNESEQRTRKSRPQQEHVMPTRVGPAWKPLTHIPEHTDTVIETSAQIVDDPLESERLLAHILRSSNRPVPRIEYQAAQTQKEKPRHFRLATAFGIAFSILIASMRPAK